MGCPFTCFIILSFAASLISVAVTADDIMTLYADGHLVAGPLRHWNVADLFNLPANTKVIAIQATNLLGKKGILGSFKRGSGEMVVTDDTWRCTSGDVGGKSNNMSV